MERTTTVEKESDVWKLGVGTVVRWQLELWVVQSLLKRAIWLVSLERPWVKAVVTIALEIEVYQDPSLGKVELIQGPGIKDIEVVAPTVKDYIQKQLLSPFRELFLEK